jgi:predicted ABC-type exoprotein transport system permease subunit
LRHAHRRSYAAFLRIAGIATIFVLPLMLYVMLTANLTSLNYKLARVEEQKLALQAETMRQDDRIAKLESRERLAALAARLKMHDPQVYAVISPPRTQTVPAPAHGIALLGAMNQWLSAAAGDVAK